MYSWYLSFDIRPYAARFMKYCPCLNPNIRILNGFCKLLSVFVFRGLSSKLCGTADFFPAVFWSRNSHGKRHVTSRNSCNLLHYIIATNIRKVVKLEPKLQSHTKQYSWDSWAIPNSVQRCELKFRTSYLQ